MNSTEHATNWCTIRHENGFYIITHKILGCVGETKDWLTAQTIYDHYKDYDLQKIKARLGGDK